MASQWKVRLIFIHEHILYADIILPISATVDDIIIKCYEYVNYIGIPLRNEKNFNINQLSYIRPLTTGDIIMLLTDGIINNNNNNMFGKRSINDIGRFTPLAAIYYPTNNCIWNIRGGEKEIAIGCTTNNLSLLIIMNDVETLNDNLSTSFEKLVNILLRETIHIILPETNYQLISRELNEVNIYAPILSHLSPIVNS
jgi:hypothetical protein